VSDEPDDQLTFAAAMEELTTLVDELESDSLDVDQLTERVARAADLVQWCRDRIDGARFSVEEVLVRLEAEPDTGD
jgi:exodeoxyribonuclease VII small subunit